MKRVSTQKKNSKLKDDRVWDLSLLYASSQDPAIEKDIQTIEKECRDFARECDTSSKAYLTDNDELLKALTRYEKLQGYFPAKPLIYYFLRQSLDSTDTQATAESVLIGNRVAKAGNNITFFPITIGTIPSQRQKELLADKQMSHFHFLLSCVCEDAQHLLGVAEEKIMSLKYIPAHAAWVTHNEKILDSQKLVWNNKTIGINEALEKISGEKTQIKRKKLADKVYKKLSEVSVYSEGEINAVITNKKIDDELRGYDTPYASTISEYRNKREVVENLRKVVTDNFHIAHRFGKIHAQLLGHKKLFYSDRAASIGTLKTKYTFDESIKRFKEVLKPFGNKYTDILDSYLKNGQIDVYPRTGKTGGAYCMGSYTNPTFVFLNHVDAFKSYTTVAHEMGHAFHTELSRSRGPVYSSYSYALAETASTLFENMAIDAVLDTLPKQEKIIVLHDKINSAIATIMRQIACFNFELELHDQIRAKGYIAKEEIGDIHNKHMQAYLGPTYTLRKTDGTMFVSWGHIRRFFYVYSYAYGHIVSNALIARYRQDPSFWSSIEKFLSAGGVDSPENILSSIGIHVTKPDFFRDGLRIIEEDIAKLESLI